MNREPTPVRSASGYTSSSGIVTASTSADQETLQERHDTAEELAPLPAATVYEIIARDGVEEMRRPLTSLWWSGVAAGLGISVSLYMMASLRVVLDGAPGAALIEKFGYCAGFLIVVLGRLQLFTENTITPVLPVLQSRNLKTFQCLARMWTVVFTANLVGTFLAASLPLLFPVASPQQMAAVLDIAMHFAHRTPLEAFFTGIPAGFLVAAMVWMLPSSKGFELWTIVAITASIAIADTSHVIVGSTEVFVAALSGKLEWVQGALLLSATALGNILGGTGLFALLAYGQVREEL